MCILSGVKVERSPVKDQLLISGNDIELVSRSAALINMVHLPLWQPGYCFHGSTAALLLVPFLSASGETDLCHSYKGFPAFMNWKSALRAGEQKLSLQCHMPVWPL